jgi:hypothetical protein
MKARIDGRGGAGKSTRELRGEEGGGGRKVKPPRAFCHSLGCSTHLTTSLLLASDPTQKIFFALIFAQHCVDEVRQEMARYDKHDTQMIEFRFKMVGRKKGSQDLSSAAHVRIDGSNTYKSFRAVSTVWFNTVTKPLARESQNYARKQVADVCGLECQVGSYIC